MQRTNKIPTRKEEFVAVKKSGNALNIINPKLNHDVSFVWDISRIQSDADDEIRKKYVDRFFIQEGLKLFVSLASMTISSLFIAGWTASLTRRLSSTKQHYRGCLSLSI